MSARDDYCGRVLRGSLLHSDGYRSRSSRLLFPLVSELCTSHSGLLCRWGRKLIKRSDFSVGYFCEDCFSNALHDGNAE